MGVTFKWAKEPVELGRDIERFGRLVGSKVEQAVRATGIEAAGRMKQNRPWSDVTGNARRGLRSERGSVAIPIRELGTNPLWLFFIYLKYEAGLGR